MEKTGNGTVFIIAQTAENYNAEGDILHSSIYFRD